MGIDAAGFNPNIQQPKTVNNPNISNVDKKAPAQNAEAVNNDPKLNLENTVNVNFNVGKTSSKELKNVNIFEQESTGKATMQSVANNIGDINKGAMYEAAKAVLSELRAQ